MFFLQTKSGLKRICLKTKRKLNEELSRGYKRQQVEIAILKAGIK